MRLHVPSWPRMYSAIASSVTLPLDATKYPRAHKCRPQYCFWMCRNSIISFREIFLLMYCMILLGDIVGGQDSRTCTWSCDTDPCRISISCVRQTSRTSDLTRVPTSPVNTFRRYLVTHTKWYFRS